MSAHSTRVTIGSKPAEALAAEYAADFKASNFQPTFPDDKPGWNEASALRIKSGLSRSTFNRKAIDLVTAGVYERGPGTKISVNGKPSATFYYRRLPSKR